MLKKNLVVLDTNIIIRFLTADHKAHYEKACKIISEIERDIIHAKIPEAVFAETVFVLQKVYGVERSLIADRLGKIIDLKGLRQTDALLYFRALEIYCSRKIDIVDCLLCAYADIYDFELASFDADIQKHGS